tara:strand:+ start:971 stop:1276 length:306 start_codon:yes stop_codon:yes gene_type:complete
MDDLIDAIVSNESPTDIHAKIKDILYAKSAENINSVRPAVTASMFGGPNPYLDDESAETETDETAPEAESEVEVGDETDVETTAETEVAPSDEEEVEPAVA